MTNESGTAAFSRCTRRGFLGVVASGAAAFALPARGAAQTVAPSNRLTVGLVGLGKMGDGHLGFCLSRPELQVVALCDVEAVRLDIQKQRAEAAYARRERRGGYNGIAAYGDFREIAARPDIDAVIVSTPDHWHALNTIEMVRAGKDVYCEKPLTLTIGEGRAMVDAVRRYGRVCQTGSQQRSAGEFRRACELVRNGRIGRVREVWANVGGPPVECYLPAHPVPEGLDWDMWLGPAPWRPYNADIAPQLQLAEPLESPDHIGGRYGGWANFRAYRDYSGGAMTDWGAHHFDIAQWALGMDDSGPVEIIPPTEGGPGHLTFKYANGAVMQHRHNPDKPRAGVTFIGTEGRVYVNRGYLESDPEHLLSDPMEPGDTRLYRSPGHHDDWLNCILHRTRPICDVSIGHRSVTVCHLGNIAYWLRRPLRWDPEAEDFVNDPQATRLIHRAMRSPWTLT